MLQKQLGFIKENHKTVYNSIKKIVTNSPKEIT